jgi:L-2,4-diaminobutyric acid acetyltransferase
LPIRYERPEVRDANAMWELARDSGALDLNSPYFYLTLSNQLSDTCIVARSGNEVVGFIVGFRPPKLSDTLFVWQITVSDSQRRKGIGHAMLRAIMSRLADDGIRYLEATVTPSNEASHRMFTSFARSYNAPCDETPLYPSDLFPNGHEAEHLLRMGPFDPVALKTEGREVAPS